MLLCHLKGRGGEPIPGHRGAPGQKAGHRDGPRPKSGLGQLIFLVKEQMQALGTAITNFFIPDVSCHPFEL
jgi:hypothetical protein